ncbi:MAG: glutamate--cysteine ligase [Betaproteobacteria bacterium]|nr:glutamate--cysteine ligase [Betaproteobacteria bacterium]MDH5535240.1 glutamate--cysteine ligase [Betaproteobacteria bacterium]
MLQERLSALSRDTLRGMRRGIEKESLRTQPDGALARTAHAAALGSALSHPSITTDFSESQLELITGVHASPEACIEEVTRIHQYVYRHIGDELLWAASMPCGLPEENRIPIGRYGTSNIGRAKTVYRNGLSWRYGRRMQTISGVHYNWSLPGVGNDGYFALIRNFRRCSWLLLYLFGASPAVCKSFVAGRAHDLEALADDTLYRPWATSLRMGRLGYQSEAQALLCVSYNSLESYGGSLQGALTQPYPPYEQVGIREPGAKGDAPESYRQLSTTLLQIENEFYGTIRPKRRIRQGERPLHALRERGVEYVEVRLMDLDPFEPIGIHARTMRFLDLFLLHCLLAESPPDTPEEVRALARNQQLAATRGREPGLQLERDGSKAPLPDLAGEVLAECAPIAARLDEVFGGSHYGEALAAAHAVLRNPASAPSARMLAEMAHGFGNSYTAFVLERSRRHRQALTTVPLPRAEGERFARLAAASIAEQKAIEAADTLPFEEYRRNYLAVEQLGV